MFQHCRNLVFTIKKEQHTNCFPFFMANALPIDKICSNQRRNAYEINGMTLIFSLQITPCRSNTISE